MKTIRFSTLMLTSLVLTTSLFAQTQPHSQHHVAPKKTSKSGMMDGKMMAGCHEMMQQQQQMHKDMKAMDDKIDGLVATMNSASSSDKPEAMASVINAMVMQHKQMHEKMSSMQAKMMAHMMEHMQQGGKKSMMQCPMMATAGKSGSMMGHDKMDMKGK